MARKNKCVSKGRKKKKVGYADGRTKCRLSNLQDICIVARIGSGSEKQRRETRTERFESKAAPHEKRR